MGISLGWYRVESGGKEYRRVGGHWVTVVGDEADARLIVHDPAPRCGLEPAREIVALRKIERGTLTGKERNLPRSASGWFLLEGGMHIKKSADCAILDGVVACRRLLGKASN